MSAYLISEVDVRVPAGFEAYRTIAAQAIVQYGGRYLGAAGRPALWMAARLPRTSSSLNFPGWKN
jgi:uncharacterized protein (DUF1330 family)